MVPDSRGFVRNGVQVPQVRVWCDHNVTDVLRDHFPDIFSNGVPRPSAIFCRRPMSRDYRIRALRE